MRDLRGRGVNYCALCKINFSSVSSFDAHISISEGFLHMNPEDCGLHETPRGWSLPPPMRPLTRDEWSGIFRKEES